VVPRKDIDTVNGSPHTRTRCRATSVQADNVPMACILLVSGKHLSGKSTLAEQLRTTHGFEVVSVDEVYVEWVKSECPSLYFDDLQKYIHHHYHYILVDEYTKDVLGRDLIAEWHRHLLGVIFNRSQQHERLVVEGYLLFDCKDQYEVELTEQSMQVFQIHVENDRYFLIRVRTVAIDEIASLGT
jgi:hypothetical protein